MSFPAYPEYKDSEITWIGAVPTSWEVKPFKWLLSNNDGGVWGDDPTGEGDTLVLRSTDQTVDGNWRLTDPAPRKLSAKEKASALIVEGDLVVTKSSGSSLHIGKTTLVTADIAKQGCCYGNFMQRLRVNSGFTPKLAWYVMNNELARAQLDLLSNSTTGLANLNGTLIGEILLPVSTVAEQTQIVRFLDHETARIDALIEEQQRLIELLKEKRQAVISHAVTKGLDPAVPMKDSGVEWLGEVPQHWQVGALGYFAGIDTGATPDRGNPEYWGGDIPWIKTGEVNYGNISQAEEHITREGVRNSAAKVAPKGTLLMAMYGQGVTRGRVAILDIEAAYNQACAGIFVDSRVRVEFLRLFFIAAYPYIRDGGNETSQMNLSSGHIAKIKITAPPINEQISVEYFLNAEMLRFDSLINEAGLLAQYLQERRSALISAAVTGKIDVRGWRPPARAQSPELEDEAV